MARPEFPSTPIGPGVKSGTTPVEQNAFVQPVLEGMEPEQTLEIELGNCLVVGSVTFRKRVKGNEWHCQIHA